MNFFVRNLNTKVLENKTFLISVNKNFSNLPEAKSLHLSAKVAFQFEGRSNFAFDCFIMAVHFVLYLTYYFFHLICGGGLKSRFSLPFYKFYRWFPLKLNTTSLRFWLDLKFLVFDSYVIDLLTVNYSNFFYFNYFPLTFFYSIFEFSSSIFNRMSVIAREISSYKNKFYRRQNSFFFDSDFHVSSLLGKGVTRIKVPGWLNFFRYKVEEYYIVNGLEKSSISLVQSNNEQRKMVPLYPFFKKRFFFIFLNKMKVSLVSSLFGFFFHFFFLCKHLILFFSFLIFQKINKFLVFVFFFRNLFSFFNSFFFLNFYNKFLKNFYFFKFFFFEFFLVFFKYKLRKKLIFFFIYFVYFFKFFLFKFFNFLYFFFSLDFFNYKFTLKNSLKKVSFFCFSNIVLLKFSTSLLDNFCNPFSLVYNKGFFKLSGFHSVAFSKYFVNFIKARPVFVFFSFFVFIRFFFFLFFFLFKTNFMEFSCDFDFFVTRFFFFRLFSFMLSFFRIFGSKKFF